MNFERKAVERCLKASRGDPNLAYEFLLSGIPLNIEKQLEQQEKLGNQTQTGGNNESNPLEEFLQQNNQGQEDLPDINLEAILNQIPNFNQIRQTIQQKPELLTPIMEKIAETSPELYQLIQQYPDEFLRIINDKKHLFNKIIKMKQINNNNNLNKIEKILIIINLL